MSSHLTTTNLSLFSIPIYWTLALWPQAYSAFIIKSANNSNWNNANPRGSETIESYKKTVPAEVYGRFERAKAAHNNLMENAPLFIGSVVVGHIAQLSPSKSPSIRFLLFWFSLGGVLG
ncbi:hypothetical protein BU24DRAFT_417816 [Aaosphaeria arxii CBS 175.79]|uniref:MAPEG-domain-containing protein n=1 Tax=Aaosphaeria arxii CBS 175.79 TaxID=1450172 RepID=A0A6A5Y9A1_9PLEO|nr:uncharacterized protein BU24DRAFT_417816 [Aaosphaeria arxii CBS 175.79]KAF2022165.1 hypothetical protein BU24DRAFT_417816 [Aaosphaeria arxii CBS 175.79]